MNCTLLTLTGLLLAVPLAAQQPSANEIKASELLQLSAEQAMAGNEAKAQKLASMAVELLAAKGAPLKGEIRIVAEENDHMPKGGVMIVEGPDGREIIEFMGSEDVVVPSEEFLWMTDDDVHQRAPMDGGDLHQQLREIQYELESLRHELHALRSEMGGGRRGGMQGQRRLMRFSGGDGNWFPEGNHDLRGGGRIRFQKDFSPGQMQRIELHGTEDLPQNLRLHTLGLEGLEGLHHLEGFMELHSMGMPNMEDVHGMILNGETDFDFDFEAPEGAEMHKEVVVIINGEKFTGDAAMKKLEELNIHDMGEGQIRVRVEGHNGAFPTPPEPPKAPRQNRWRSKGHDHEDA